MISMTGYGYKEFQDEKVRFTLEIKSYNNRYLDLILNLPGPLSPLEGRVRSLLGDSLKRGRVEVYLRMKELEEDLSLIVDEAAVKSYAATLRKVKALAEIDAPLNLAQILSMDGVVKTEKNRDLERFWELLEPLFREVLAQLKEDRRREGESTREDIFSQIALLERLTEQIAASAPEMEQAVRRNLQEKFAEVLEGQVDEGRLLSEVAVQLVRFDINEELVRLRTHFATFREIAENRGEPMGKKLDFLCQEINREVNTVGSKSTLVEINRLVVDMKDALEKVREQLRNVE